MSELVIIAIDIEARGQGPVTHGIISIGVCVGNSSREEVIEKRRFDLLPLPGQSIEKRCFDECKICPLKGPLVQKLVFATPYNSICEYRVSHPL